MSAAKYISKILFDNKLDEYSYLNDLPIIKYLSKEKEIFFSSNVTFLSVKTVQANPPYLKQLLLHMVLMRKVVLKALPSQPTLRTLNFAIIFPLPKRNMRAMASFFVQKAFIMLQPILMKWMQKNMN